MNNLYHYKESGLSNIYLANGYVREETSFGEAIKIDNVEALHEAIGLFLVDCPMRVTGEVLKFLRVQLGMTQKNMGKTVFLHADGQSLALWEKNRTEPIPAQAEIILRSFYKEAKSGISAHVTRMLEQYAEDDCAKFHDRRIKFHNDHNNWSMCA